MRNDSVVVQVARPPLLLAKSALTDYESNIKMPHSLCAPHNEMLKIHELKERARSHRSSLALSWPLRETAFIALYNEDRLARRPSCMNERERETLHIEERRISLRRIPN